ncbi:MAG: hypothetical protein QOG63_833 [Thermoleophilaceae bacterium]|jgi:hypothetical protein|nr:hypothetical protein [Thermoleophilaceae bacterium]
MRWPLTRTESLQALVIGVVTAIVAAVLALAGAGMIAFYAVPIAVLPPTLMLLHRGGGSHGRR